MHEKASRNVSTCQRSEITEVKNRRHNLRKVLLTLDYIVEFVGSVFVALVYFFGDQLLVQHILLTVGWLIYGIAIPLTHLLNETRVRDVILSHGWTQGFKSIFYSSKKIKEIERKKRLNTLNLERFPLPSDNHLSRLAPFKQLDDDIDLLKENSSIECCSDEAQGLIQVLNSSRDTSKKSSSNNLRDDSTIVSNCEGCTCTKSTDYNVVNVNAIVHCLVEPKLNEGNEELNQSKDYSNESTGKLQGLSVYHCHGAEDNTNVIKMTASAQRNTAICTAMDKSNVSNPKEPLTKDMLPNDTETMIRIFDNTELKLFSRSYILSRMLHELHKYENESNYTKYFRFLCSFENYPKNDRATDKAVDLRLSLFNSWCLSKKRVPSNFRINEIQLFEGKKHITAKKNTGVSGRYYKRKQTIKLLIKNVSLDDQFANHLEKLYECENNQDNDIVKKS